MAKKRIDVLLVDKGLAPSREKARAYIMAGQVKVDKHKVDKPGTMVDEALEIELMSNPIPYVSRGGLKLEKAMTAFDLNITDFVMADIGASTGGFSDCALQKGVKKVFAVDVGYGQLDWKLRQDPRVVNMERTNARYLKLEDLGEALDLATIDVAFISLTKILPTVKILLKENGWVIALIKPQFEAGKEQIGKKGVVKDAKVHQEVITNVIFFAQELNLQPQAISYSPIKGPEGNIEYLAWMINNGPVQDKDWQQEIVSLVEEAKGKLEVRG